MKIQRASTTAVVPIPTSSNGNQAGQATHENPTTVQQQQQQQQQKKNESGEPARAAPVSAVESCYLQDTRTHVVAELYDTERSYVESLQIIIEKYMKPLKNLENSKALIESSLVDEIFYTIPEILQHHENFLSALQARLSSDWDSSQVIGNVFIEAFTNQQIIDTYTAFINNWKNARHAIKVAIQAKPAFERFLEAMSREHRNKLTLDALLIMPVQRIPRYELLIKELIKHTAPDHPDHGPLIEAQRQIHDLALKIDRAEREMLHQEQLKELEALIEGLVELQHPQRDFIRYDLVTISASTLTVAKKERVLFLFCDLLIISSVKKKVSRRSNLQAAFANSTNDLSLLEGNKFKLILRVSLDQMEVRHEQLDSQQLAGSRSWLQQQHQQQHRQQIQEQQLHVSTSYCKDLIEDRRRELESDLFLLQQIEILSSQMSQVDRSRLNTDLHELNEQLHQALINLDRHQNECDQSANQQQLSLQISAQLVHDLYPPQRDQQQPQQLQTQMSHSSSNSNAGTPQHHHKQLAMSVSSGEQQEAHKSNQIQHDASSLEFVISNQIPQKDSSSKNLDTSNLSASASLLNGAADPTTQQAATSYETLVVTFASRDRRQAFLQAFLEAKQARLNQIQQQQQRMFNSSVTMRLGAGGHASEQLSKSQSIASDVRRNRLRHQDRVLDMRLMTSGEQRAEERNLSAPCMGTIVHQMSEPMGLACGADELERRLSGSPQHAADNKALSNYCTPCSPNTCGLDSETVERCQPAHHHHHQLMHQPASHPALLHTICCHERHNDTAPAARLLNKSDQMLNFQRASSKDDECSSSIISLESDPDRKQERSQRIMELAPRFLMTLPIDFLNTQHPALQFTCAVARNTTPARPGQQSKCQTVGDNLGQLWLCMSNGYVSHIALIAFERGQAVGGPVGAADLELVPVVRRSGDICKSQINCAAQVVGRRSPRSLHKGHTFEAKIKSKAEAQGDTATMATPTVSVKAASPPVDIAAKCPSSQAARTVSRSAPSASQVHGPFVDTELENFLRSAQETKQTIRRQQQQDKSRLGAFERRGSVIRHSSCDNERRRRAVHPGQRSINHRAHQHQHHHSHEHLACCIRWHAHRAGPAGLHCTHLHSSGQHCARCQHRNQWTVSHQHNWHHGHGHGHGHSHHHHHHQQQQQRQQQQQHQNSHHQAFHQHHHAYHGKHHTMALGELRQKLERQGDKSAVDQDGRDHYSSFTSHRRTQLQIPTGERTLGTKSARSSTPPPRYLSHESHKSLRSTRQLRHQASLKTSSILAKLVGTASRGSSYLRKSSQQQQRAAEKSDVDDNDTDTENAKKPDCSSLESNSALEQASIEQLGEQPMSVNTNINNRLQVLKGSNVSVNNSVVSPLSSASSLNSTNSSITINSVCGSSAGRSHCELVSDSQLFDVSQTCCALAQPRYSFNRQDSAGRDAEEQRQRRQQRGQIRSRSATVPSRPFCEQRLPDVPLASDICAITMATEQCAQASGATDCYKVSKILENPSDEPATRSFLPADQKSTLESSAPNHTDSESIRTRSLWLGCDDGTLVVIDCLGSEPRLRRSESGSSNSCNICHHSSELGCQNVHSEVKLGAPIGDIKNQQDERVFVALTNGQLAVFSRRPLECDESEQSDGNGPKMNLDGEVQPGDWALMSPHLIRLATSELHSTSRLCIVGERHLWYSHGRSIFVLDTRTLELMSSVVTPASDKSIQFAMQTIAIEAMELANELEAVWVAFKGSPLLQLYDTSSAEASPRLLLEISLLESINKVLSCGNAIIRQHKTACLGATALLNRRSSDEQTSALFVGTSAGIIIYLTVRHDQLPGRGRRGGNLGTAGSQSDATPNEAAATVEGEPVRPGAWWDPQVVSLRHGHSGQVKFLRLVEVEEEQQQQTGGSQADQAAEKRAGIGKTKCLVSGGAGIDLYGPNQAQQVAQQLSGDEDSLSQLMMWQLRD